MLPVIANTYRCALEWVNTDDPQLTASNVIHVRKSSSNPAAIATIIDAAVVADMWRAQCTHSAVAVVNVTPLDGTGVTYPFATGSPSKWKGSQTTNAPVPQVCNIIKLVTAKRGRSYRGRVYVPWIDRNVIVNEALQSAFPPLIAVAWQSFVSSLSGSGAKLVVASYKLSTAEDVVAISCEFDVATQRRRLHRVATAY